MQVLEKILEEIDEAIERYKENANMEAVDICYGMKVAKKIIRNHMNDGWVSVEERLPDNSEDVLVTTDVGLITFGCLLNGKWIIDQEPDYPIAWQPLPEPYRPEQPETCKYTGGSCCWPIDQCRDCPNHPGKEQ